MPSTRAGSPPACSATLHPQRESLAAAVAAGIFTCKTPAPRARRRREFADIGGRYLDDCREAYTVPDDASLAEHPHGVKQWALDHASADRLWARSLELLAAAG